MKKILIIIVFINLSFSKAYCQGSFTKLIVNNHESKAFNINEIKKNTYLFCGAEMPTNGYMKGYLAIIDYNGNLVNQQVYSDTIGDVLFMNIINHKNGSTIIGSIDYSDSTNLIILNIDSNLNVKSSFSTRLNIPNIQQLAYFSTIFDSDSNYFITGSYFDSTIFGVYPFIMIVDSLGNTLVEKHNNGFIDSSFDIYNAIEINNRYRVSVAAFENGGNQILIFDKNLNYISKSIVINSSGSIANIKKRVDDSGFVFVGPSRKGNDINILLVRYDTMNHVIDSVSLGESDTLEYACFSNCLSVQESYIYTGATSNIYPSMGYYGNGVSRSSYLLNKFDNNLDLLWSKKCFYPNSYLLLLDIHATSDGGCILLGTRRDNNSIVQKTDILIIKLDSNGTTTWTQNIPIPQVGVELFPNPASTTISLKLANTNQKIQNYRILDLQGKTLLQQQAYQNHIQINISSLISGLYIIEGQTASGAIFRRKFVKE